MYNVPETYTVLIFYLILGIDVVHNIDASIVQRAYKCIFELTTKVRTSTLSSRNTLTLNEYK